MKILILGPQDCHTARWVRAFSQRGHEVVLATMEVFEPVEVPVHRLFFPRPYGYYLNFLNLRSVIKKFQPTVFQVNYGSGYGTLGRLVNYHPCVLSVWGSDVFQFPYQSALSGRIIRRNLRHYDHVCSTSRIMADQVRILVPDLGGLTTIPFGVDTDRFAPAPGPFPRDTITVGTIKALEPVYGIDVLVRGFALCRQRVAAQDPGLANRLRLRIVGGGSQEGELRALILALGIEQVTIMTGYLPHEQIPGELKKLDLFVAVSRAESFGVAVVEASASGLPVIASRVGGLPEVVETDRTGFLVEPDQPTDLADKMEVLVRNQDLARSMGARGRAFVEQNYQWGRCVDRKLEVYENLVARTRVIAQ